MNLEMNLVSALAHILELIIAFQFFSELFNGKGKKIVAAAVGFVFYAAACAAYLLFNKTLLNIVFCFVINAVLAKLFFDCKAKGALLGSLFISVSDTAADFIVRLCISAHGAPEQVRALCADKGGGLCGIVSARQKGCEYPGLSAYLSRGVHSYSLYVLDNLRAL